MGIQINGQTDIISATDGSLTVSGADLTNPVNVNISGVGTIATLIVTGNASIGGTITYMDVTNVDSVGIITAQVGLQVLANGINITGVSTVAAGSTAAPSITPTGDTNTGIFFPSADTIAFGEGGSEAVRIDSSGRLGVGAADPGYAIDVASADTTAGIGYALRLRQNATAGAAAIQFTDNPVTTQRGYIACDSSSNLKFATGVVGATIDSSGNFGIGITNPSSSLHVAGSRDSTPTQPGVHIGEGGTNDFALDICCRNSSANSYIDFTHPGQDYKGRVIKTMGGAFSIQNTEATSMTLYNNGDNRLIIDSSGRVRMPFQPAFMAGSGTGTHTTNAGSVLDFNTEGNSGFDVGGNFNTTNYRFTAPIAGIYAFSSNIYVQNSGTASSFCWRKNGTELLAPGGNVMISFSLGVTDLTISSSILLNLAANDFVDIAVRADAVNVQWYGAHSTFSGYLIG